ncbi:MAG: hypothetical protein PHC35_06350 [Deltaproteobacteria bacterium]|nr:hypothetical protein [Deltaproteobacteria bacterium]
MLPEFFTIGLVSLLGQIVLLRELSVATYGVELIYLLGMAGWLIGSSLGAGLGRRRGTGGYSAVLWIFLLYSLLLPLDMVFLRLSRWLLGGVTGAFLPFHLQILTLILSVIPLSFLMGMAFQRAARLWIAECSETNALARAYGWECIGSVAAGGLATLAPAFHVPNSLTGLCCASFPLLLIFCRMPPLKKIRAVSVVSVLLAVFFAVSAVFVSPIDLWTSGFNHPFLKAVADTPYGRIAVTSLEGQTTIFENDSVSFETESNSAEELVHSAALQHSAPRSVLLLGGGLEGLVEEALKYASVQTIDCVELNQELIRTTLPFLTDERRKALSNQRVRFIYEDPRRFLLRSSGEYDLILVAMPEPSSGQANRFYTREFFQLCRTRLSTGGVMGFRLSASENFWSQQLITRNRAIVSAVKGVFQDVMVLPGSINLVLAGDQLTIDTGLLARRYEAAGLANRLVIPQYLQYLISSDRFQEVAGHMWKEDAAGLMNTDKRPVCYSLTIRLWLSRFFPGVLTAEGPLAGYNGHSVFWGIPLHYLQALGVFLAIAVLFRLLRGGKILSRAGVMCWAAFWSAVLETVLLLQYQVASGALYGELGLLLMALMVGMSVGALVFGALSPSRMLGAVLVSAMTCTGLLAAWGVDTGFLSGFWSVGPLMLICGLLLAGVFAYLSHDRLQERLAAPLYTADLVGGAIGTVFAVLYAIPFWGLDQAALFTGLWSIGVIFGM